MRRAICLSVLAVLLSATAAMAANTVVIPSMNVDKGQTGVVIPVMLTNDIAAKSVIVPLVFREQTPGAFVTSITMGFGDRLPVGGPITAITFRNQYAAEDGVCKDAKPGGFGTILSATGGPNPVTAPPEGVLFVRQKLFESALPPGSDATGSMLLTVDVTAVDGTFLIDTTCANPANHLMFIQDITNAPYIPAFTPSIITIGTGGSQNQPPVAICQDVTVEAGAGCEATVAASQVDNGSSDPDGDPITFALQPAGPYALGATPVTLIVTDDSGDADTCGATITIVDTTDPVITSCPGAIAVQCSADVPPANIVLVTATDHCGVTISHEGDVSDNLSCPETITRTYRATDAGGNFVECQQLITVDDTQPPVLGGCPGDLTVQCLSEVPAPAEVTASDNCDGVTLSFTEVDNATGNPCGGTIVRTWTATDGCDNTDQCTQTITVNDTEAPQLLLCAPDLNFQCAADVPVCDAVSDVTFGDNCAAPTVDCSRSDNGGAGTVPDPLIITDVYTATDGCGNTADCSRTITVIDDTPPDPGCPGNIVRVVGAGETEAVVTWTSNYSDNCAGGGVVCDPPSGSTFPLGPTTVTCTATDAAGNTDICTFTVTVTSESVPPVAQCTDVTVSAGVDCSADVSIDDGSYDPDGGPVTLEQDPPGPYPLGATVVQLTVTDDEGSSSTCTASVTVVDDTPPAIICFGDITVDVLAGEPGAYVDFSSAAQDNCPDVTLVCSPASGSLFPVGQTTVTCTAQDAAGNTSTCSFTVTVNEISTNPPVAVDDYKVTRGGVMLKVVGAGVLVNDSDPDGDPLTAVLDTDVSIGTLTLHPDGSFDYVAPVDYVGPVEFTYYAFDGLVNSVSPATVHINVKPNMFFVADFDQDGYITMLDIGAEVDALFANGPNPRSIECNASCADFNCDGEPNSIDLGLLIDHVFGGGPGPCDPCAD